MTYAKNEWNSNYDINIAGYNVEVYIQDINEEHTASGIYSLSYNKWIIEPQKQNFVPDEKMIKQIAIGAMDLIDELLVKYRHTNNYDVFYEDYKKIWDKIKRYRQDGLASEHREFSIGNLVFKFLRRNGYIGKLFDFRRKKYIYKYENK